LKGPAGWHVPYRYTRLDSSQNKDISSSKK
jgi:hypothetical protein